MNEQLITLLIFGLLAAISTWLNKRRQNQEDQSVPPPTSATPPGKARRTASWEQEMRRLLEGQAPTAPPPPPRTPASQPMAPPIIVGTRPPARAQRRSPAAAAAPALSTSALLEQARGRKQEALQRKAQADARLQSVLRQVESTQPAGSRPASRVQKLLADRESIRSVFVASLLLGPPKALSHSGEAR